MSSYRRLLGLAREQQRAISRGDYAHAIALLDHRAALLTDALPPMPSDADTIREILLLARELGEALGAEALRLREQASQSQRRKDLLSRYRSPVQAPPALLDSER
jgi:hypothetical protein